MKVPRNSPCPCGSGLKSKKCCDSNEAQALKAKAKIEQDFLDQKEKEKAQMKEISPLLASRIMFKGNNK